MSAQPTPTPSLYERDFYAWTQEQTALLKAGRLADLDTTHLIEEIEGLGASERRELYSRLRVLLVHLLKWHYQSGKRSESWTTTINEQRAGLEDLLESSPSLKSLLEGAPQVIYQRARRYATKETGLPPNTFPDTCPFTLEQVLDEDFWPD